MATEQEIRDLKRRHSAELLSLPEVVGVGIEMDSEDGYVLAVHLAGNARAEHDLPERLEGYPVKYIRSGPFQKFPAGG